MSFPTLHAPSYQCFSYGSSTWARRPRLLSFLSWLWPACRYPLIPAQDKQLTLYRASSAVVVRFAFVKDFKSPDFLCKYLPNSIAPSQLQANLSANTSQGQPSTSPSGPPPNKASPSLPAALLLCDLCFDYSATSLAYRHRARLSCRTRISPLHQGGSSQRALTAAGIGIAAFLASPHSHGRTIWIATGETARQLTLGGAISTGRGRKSLSGGRGRVWRTRARRS